MASFVAKNGPKFEEMVKNKEDAQINFPFLFGGPYHSYYLHRLQEEIRNLSSANFVSRDQMPVSTPSVEIINYQANFNEIDTFNHFHSNQEIIIPHEETRSILKFDELDEIFDAIIQNCTKSRVQSGRNWIMSNCNSEAECSLILNKLVNRISGGVDGFNSKLRLLYLFNDLVLAANNGINNNKGNIQLCRWMLDQARLVATQIFQSAFLDAGNSSESVEKLDKVLKIWESNSVFPEDLIGNLWKRNFNVSRVSTQKSIPEVNTQTFENRNLPTAKFLQCRPETSPEHNKNEMNQSLHSHSYPHRNFPNSCLHSQRFQPLSTSFDASYHEYHHSTQNFHNSNETERNFDNPRHHHHFPQPAVYNELFPFSQSTIQHTRFDSKNIPTDPHHHPFNNLPMVSNIPVADNTRDEQHHSQALQNQKLKYYELPAGLMVNLVQPEDMNYKPLDPEKVSIPPPQPPTERFLKSVEAFYSTVSHDTPRDNHGWERNGLYEFMKRKLQHIKGQQRNVVPVTLSPSPSSSPKANLSTTSSLVSSTDKDLSIFKADEFYEKPTDSPCSSVSITDSESEVADEVFVDSNIYSNIVSASLSRSPTRSWKISGNNSTISNEKAPSSLTISSKKRPPTPPEPFIGFSGTSATAAASFDTVIDESNIGHKMLRKMGWEGSGLGKNESGIQEPIRPNEVRDNFDKYKGVGAVVADDPYDNFRRSKASRFGRRK